jgi:2-oxoglutarate ferredoxin oxidoreductase subunit delta
MTYRHRIDVNYCKGCGLCVTVCPKNVLEISRELNAKGYYPAFQARPDDCIYCGACCLMCPDVAISIEKTGETSPQPKKK